MSAFLRSLVLLYYSAVCWGPFKSASNRWGMRIGMGSLAWSLFNAGCSKSYPDAPLNLVMKITVVAVWNTYVVVVNAMWLCDSVLRYRSLEDHWHGSCLGSVSIIGSILVAGCGRHVEDPGVLPTGGQGSPDILVFQYSVFVHRYENAAIVLPSTTMTLKWRDQWAKHNYIHVCILSFICMFCWD